MSSSKREGPAADPSAAAGTPAGGTGSDPDSRREALFVGRGPELETFEALLAGTGEPRVVAVTGIGGIGKSTLVRAWERRARDAGVDWTHVDGGTLPASPGAFEAAVGAMQATDDSVRVIAVDAFEHLLPLEGWLRDRFVPRLSGNTILVLAGRWTPGARWRADPGIARMLVDCSLEGLAPGDAAEYLERREVPAGCREAVQGFAHGLPLALALAADRIERDPGAGFSPESSPDLIHALVQWLLEGVGGDRRLHALEACALVQYMTEPLLSAMLDTADTAAPFDWLARQNYIELNPQGLAMHELVREPIVRELRWRDPARYRAMVRRACDHYIDSIGGASAERGIAAVAASLYVLRQEPYVQYHFHPGDMEHYIDTCRIDELPLLADMLAAFEGGDAAARFLQWAHASPQSVAVARDRECAPRGFALVLTFGADDVAAGLDADDPGIASFCRHVHDHAPLRGGRIALFMRFVLARDDFQESGPVWSQLATYGNGLYFTPGLAFFAMAADVSRDWWGTGEHADAPLLEHTEFESGGRRFRLLAHDMRSEPPLEWARNSVDRILGEVPGASETSGRPRLMRRAEFEAAVIHALQNFHHDETLRRSALHDSRLVDTNHRDPEALRQTLADISREMLDDGARGSPHRVLAAAYFDPSVPKQVAAAEAFCVAERTFRRWLRRAESRLVEQLWQRETRWG